MLTRFFKVRIFSMRQITIIIIIFVLRGYNRRITTRQHKRFVNRSFHMISFFTFTLRTLQTCYATRYCLILSDFISMILAGFFLFFLIIILAIRRVYMTTFVLRDVLYVFPNPRFVLQNYLHDQYAVTGLQQHLTVSTRIV